MESSLRVRRLTIGSDSFEHVQLPQAAVAPRHAIIEPRAGQLSIRTCGRARLKVNGRWRSRASLAEGDVIEIGTASLIIRRATAGAPVAIEIRESETRASPAHATFQALSLRGTRISARVWSWALVLAVLGVLVVPPLSASLYPPSRPVLRSGWAPGDQLWEPGALHVSHQFIGANCNACHVTPFQRVSNAQCSTCHKAVQHHVDVRTRKVSLFSESRCSNCHAEHEEPVALVPHDSRLCTDCHANLRATLPETSLANASDFGTDHPEFNAISRPRADLSNLRFSHAVHLDPAGIKTNRGYEILKCQSCHQPNTSGRQMLPIRMKEHCSRCHSLQFDEHDPATVVPHGDVDAVLGTLQAHFIREFLDSPRQPDPHGSPAARRPGGESEVMTRDEQRRARDWATRQSQLVADELIGKRVCVQCHQLARRDTQWTVAAVRFEPDWMPRAQFNHASHSLSACTTCHKSAPQSKQSSDVLMPSIQTCRSCHGGASDVTKLASDCGMCHRFHLPGRGSFDAGARSAQTARAATGERAR